MPGRANLCDCGATIVWVKTTNSAMPLDAHEVRSGATERSAMVCVPTEFDNGNIILEAGVVRVVAPGPGQFRSHFVECPNAERHRRR